MARRLYLPPVPMSRAAGGWPGTSRWRPGRPASPPQHVYTRRMTAPIGGNGVGQSPVAGFAAASGSANAPVIGATICGVTPVAGIYTVAWSVTLSGTLSGADVNNFGLFLGALGLATSVNPAVAGTYPQAPVQVTTAGGLLLSVGVKTNNATAGSVYAASLPGQPPAATVRIGPSGLGTRWYPQQITLATSTGPADTSTAIGYLGPVAASNSIIFTSYAGGGDIVGLAIPMMQPGDLLTVVWSGGHPGDWAQLVITGDQDILTPG